MKKKLNTTKINIIILFSFITPILFLSGCTQQQTNQGINTISMENFAFNPNTLTISNGTTVTWINNDNVDHIVSAEGGLFNSGTLSKGENFTYTFTETGTYNYFCSIHPGMKGIIIVQQTSMY